LLCKVDESVGARNLHFVVNGGRAAIEGAAKEEGEAKDVVYLIWEIRSPGTDDGVGPRLAREVRVYLWVGISHRENKWIGRHLLNHLLGYTVTVDKPKKISAPSMASAKVRLSVCRA
jgi:hypothetical protein